MNRAGPTLACIAPYVRSGEPETITEIVNKELSRFHFGLVSCAIDGDRYGNCYGLYLSSLLAFPSRQTSVLPLPSTT